ncbi:MAG: hypothetical protein JMN24_18725 [gamma proteobacterium endosymbiont of Lamellibrachia anaximandri]|nr:hypothetical protein [gamma proteobacterium endosymbiont of Lamellibrachia anaximandri]
MTSPDLAVVYDEHMPKELFLEFKNSIDEKNLSVVVEVKEDNGPYACPEWFMLTAVAIFIGKSYFDGFLKEAGKDHYQKLKSHLTRLTNEVMSKPKIEPILVGTEGKISSNNPYSLSFSIYAEANDGNRFKLLLPKPYDTEDYTYIIHGFLEFLNDYHSGIKVLEDIGFDDNVRAPSGIIFAHMNQESKQIEWLDQREYR